MADDKIMVPIDVDHPLGSGRGVTYGDTSSKVPTPGQKVGLVLFLVGLVLAGVVAFRLSVNLGLGYLAAICLVLGVVLSYQSNDEGS